MKQLIRKEIFKYLIVGCLVLLLFVCYLNRKYEAIAFHPFVSEGKPELTVMTWNVHCSEGTDSLRQRRLAELILEVDADFVQLNEYNQDSCSAMDSLLKTRFPYTEEYQSHEKNGDIYYSKLMMSNSGHVKIPIYGKAIKTIKATIATGRDSVEIFGVHMASNRYDVDTVELKVDFKNDKPLSYQRYKEAKVLRCFQAHWTKVAVTESKHPVIVMGDMNDFNCSAPLDTFATCGLKDVWWEGGFGYGCTFHNGWLKLRIDHILHSRELKLESIKVIDTNLSDHNPVVAGFSLNTKTNRTN